MNKRNLGKFSIGRKLIDDHFDVVLEAMKDIVVVRAEYMYNSDAIEYTALSRNFRELEAGETTPIYTLIMTTRMSKTHTIDFCDL